jgi:predicted CXXCH cytochrome family protein
MKVKNLFKRVPTLVICLGLIVAIVNCTDEEKIFVERPFFEDPPPAAQGFLGLDDVDEKLTVCGNCHVGQQSKWEGTAHADAWATLQNSGQSQAFCENCHTTGPLGNATEGDVGYAGAPEERYHNVTCESCHGPGLNHVSNPDENPKPVASIRVLSVAGSDTTFLACAECHSGAHHPFVEEWAKSNHAHLESSPAGRAECISCHTAQGALQAWGVTAEFAEKDRPLGQHEPIVCAVCHDPHANVNSAQLRHPIDVPDEDRNLCMKCHHKRGVPETASATTRGPHSPEGPLLLGEAGWWPDDFEPQVDRIIASHGTERNPKLCAGCHVHSFPVTDELTGDFVVQATGHLFEPIPCLDEQGRPIPDGDCDINERSFQSCAQSGCHSVEGAKSALVSARVDIDALVDDIDALLAQLPDSLNLRNDGRFTVSDGAWFNARLGELPGSPVHNPFLLRTLLRATIRAMEEEYGLNSSLPADYLNKY